METQKIHTALLEDLYKRASSRDGYEDVCVRLQWFMDYVQHYKVSRTCRRYHIARTTFYRWWNRFDPENLQSLLGHPTSTFIEPSQQLVANSKSIDTTNHHRTAASHSLMKVALVCLIVCAMTVTTNVVLYAYLSSDNMIHDSEDGYSHHTSINQQLKDNQVCDQHMLADKDLVIITCSLSEG